MGYVDPDSALELFAASAASPAAAFVYSGPNPDKPHFLHADKQHRTLISQQWIAVKSQLTLSFFTSPCNTINSNVKSSLDASTSVEVSSTIILQILAISILKSCD
jgi:hypothetical protein